MYSFSEVKSALENDSLSIALVKLEAYAREHVLIDLADWASAETKGYQIENWTTENHYRIVFGEWRDDLNRPIASSTPELSELLSRMPVADPIVTIEPYEKIGAVLVHPGLVHRLAKAANISPSRIQGFNVSKEEMHSLLTRVRQIAVQKLSEAVRGKPIDQHPSEIDIPHWNGIVADAGLRQVLEKRWGEVVVCYKANLHLSTIVLLGSILEAVLLDKMQANPSKANTSKSTPKDKTGTAKHFKEWTLSDFIAVAHDLGLISKNTKDFSHTLREYRNLIHPREQLQTGIFPNDITSQMAFLIVHAALVDLK